MSSDEDADLLAEDRKGLANLFGNEKVSSSGQKPSLHYTAPKQPKPDKNRSVSRDTAQTVIIAVPITAQQYVDNQYVNKGRVSLAILGSLVNKEYTLIIYKTQTDRRLALKIEATLNFNVKENNFVNFYDDTRQAWAVKFDSTKDMYDVAYAIALAKANITGLKTLLLQNLLIGEGQSVVTGDTVGVLYFGWLFANGTVEKDKPFDSNVKSDKIFKVKLGEKAVIQGWDQGMVGMKKGGKKLILIPPKLGYGDKGVKGRIPPNAYLVFEVELVKAKFVVKEADSRELPMLPSIDDIDSATNVRERTASFEEQSDTSDSASKEAILKRLAKVVHPILPQGVTQESLLSHESRAIHSESSGRSTPVSVSSNPGQNSTLYPPYDPHPDPYYPPPNPHMQSVPQHQQVPFPPSQPMGYPSQAPLYQSQSTALAPFSYPSQLQFSTHPSLLAQVQPQLQPQVQPPVQGVGVGEYSQLMADTKVELGKMSLRLDDIGKKVDSLHDNSNKSLVPIQPDTQRGGLLDSGILLNSINKIVDENTHLKQEVIERDNRLEGLNQRINQLLQSNQRYVEQSQQLLEQRSDSMHSIASNQQSRFSQVELERNEVVVKFEEAKRNLDLKNLELTEFRSESDDIKRKFENLMQKMTLAKEKFREKESEIEDLKTEYEQAKRESDKAKSSHNKLTNEIDDLNTNLEELRDKLKHDRTLKIKLDSKVTSYEDEINELKEENEQFQKTVEDRKRKFQFEKQKLQAEVEELRNTHEEEIQSIKTHLNSTSSAPSPVEVAKIESSWKRKLDQAVAATEAKTQDQIEEFQSNEDKLRANIQRLEKKLSSTQSSDNQLNEQTEQLLDLTDQLRVTQDKLARSQERLHESSEELNCSNEREVNASERLHHAESDNSLLAAQLEETRLMLRKKESDQPETSVNRGELEAKIKLIMNQLFQVMRMKFELNESYDGSSVINTIMQTIRQETIRQLQPPESDSESDVEPDTDNSVDHEVSHEIEEATKLEEQAARPEVEDTKETIESSPIQVGNIPSSPDQLPEANSPEEDMSKQYIPSYEPEIEISSDPPPQETATSDDNTIPLAEPSLPQTEELPAMHDPLISSPPSTNPLSVTPPSLSNQPVTNPLSTSDPITTASPKKSSQEPISNPLLGGDSYSENDFFTSPPSHSLKKEKAPSSKSTAKQKAPESSALFSDDEDEFDWLN